MAGHAEVALTRRGEKATTQSREDSAPSMFRSLLICLRTRRNDAGREQVGKVVRVGGVAEIR